MKIIHLLTIAFFSTITPITWSAAEAIPVARKTQAQIYVATRAQRGKQPLASWYHNNTFAIVNMQKTQLVGDK